VGRTNDLTWNARYQLTEVRTNGAAAERLGYDALGRRCWTWDGSATNWHVYDGPHVVADVDATGGVVRSYVWGPGIDNLLSLTVHTGVTPRVYLAVRDHLGTVHALVDESGAVVESYRFDAWGRVLGVYDGQGTPLQQSAIGNRFLWQGREYSWATGLYYFRARWYDPVTGRWLSNDPIGISGGLNQYVFCGNNPVNFVDPWGLARYEFDSQGLHVHDTVGKQATTYIIDPTQSGDARFRAKPGHEGEFDLARAKSSLERVVKDKVEFQKLRSTVSDAYERCADKRGVGNVRKGLRRMRSSLTCLGILGVAMALNPNSSDAQSFAEAISNMNASLASGKGISDDDILTATMAVQSLYGSDIPAMKVFGDLTERQRLP
jgi:RHS repeat-associated protein